MLSQCVTAAHPLIAQPFFFPLRRQVLLVNTIPNGQLFKSSQQFPSVTMHARAESWLGQRAALAGHGAVAGPELHRMPAGSAPGPTVLRLNVPSQTRLCACTGKRLLAKKWELPVINDYLISL